MEWLLLIVIGVLFTAFTALVFSVMTLGLGKVFPAFEVIGPDDWTFFDFYKRYLIVAAVYTVVALPMSGCCLGWLLGIGALAVAYKHVFQAGWTQAFVIGGIGGVIAITLFVAMLLAILMPFGLVDG